MSDNELEPGFYWVRLHKQPHDEIACWNGAEWICMGIAERIPDKTFQQVAKIILSTKIPRP